MFNFLKSGTKEAYKLPNWAHWRDDGCVVVEVGKAYPLYLTALEVIRDASDPDADRPKITQYWLEVAQRCIQEDLRRWALVHGAEGLHLQFLRNPFWAHRQFHLETYKGGSNSADAGRTRFRLYYNSLRQLQKNGNRELRLPRWGGGWLSYKDGFKDPRGGEQRVA